MKPILQAIAIFAISLVIFVGYSKAPDYVADAIHLRQIGQTDEAEAELEADVVSDEAEPEPVDTASQRILIIGDSMSQLLALRFSDYANQNGHKLLCVTWNGSSTRQWANCDTIGHYMRTYRPTHVFVSIGSNELYTGDLKNFRKRAEQILAKIGSVPTIWIGPPNWTEDKGVNNVLQSLMGKRRFFMSKGMKLARQKDGRHPTPSAAIVWADKIVEWINSGKAVHPFRLDKPKKRSANYRQIVIPMNPGKPRHAATDSVDAPDAPDMATQSDIEGSATQSPVAPHDVVPTTQHDAAPTPHSQAPVGDTKPQANSEHE